MSATLDYSPASTGATRSQITAKVKTNHKKPPADFLWINAQEEDSRDRNASREKQAFIRARHHRLKKESQTRSLETSMQRRPADSKFPPSEAVCSQVFNYSSGRTAQSDCGKLAQSPILCQSLEACISMAFPYLSRSTNQSMTLYLQHCK